MGSPPLLEMELARHHRANRADRRLVLLSLYMVSSDSDSDSDLSSSSLEDRLPLSVVKEPKSDKPYSEPGGSVESPRMGPARRPSHLSGSQSSLASETGMGSADPQLGTPSWPDPKGPSKKHTWTIPRC